MCKPVIAITMGDPAGIGPELIVKVLSQGWPYEVCRPFVIGSLSVMQGIRARLGIGPTFSEISALSEARFLPSAIEVLRPEELVDQRFTWGKLDPAMGKAAALCLHTALDLAMGGEIDGVVSAPLNKEALHLAGYQYRDELGYLADLAGVQETFLLGIMDWVWTVAVAEHVPFRAIADLITRDRVGRYIRQTHDALVRAGFKAPRIAVAALNVHGGEGGLFGREEIDEIEPAIQEARERGIDAEGPFPADTVFVTAREGGFDGIVCMYHDQANIGRKFQPSKTGATLFMGLPVVWGTTAHGTAFDRAGQGTSDPGSLATALRCVATMSSC